MSDYEITRINNGFLLRTPDETVAFTDNDHWPDDEERPQKEDVIPAVHLLRHLAYELVSYSKHDRENISVIVEPGTDYEESRKTAEAPKDLPF
jgi:hypothetical protein